MCSLLAVLVVLHSLLLAAGRIATMSLEPHMDHCSVDAKSAGFVAYDLQECPAMERAPDPWSFIRAPSVYTNISGEQRGAACLSSIRRFVGATAETASTSAIFLNFNRMAVWIIVDKIDVGAMRGVNLIKPRSEIVQFHNERLTSVQRNENMHIPKIYNELLIRRVDYIQLEPANATLRKCAGSSTTENLSTLPPPSSTSDDHLVTETTTTTVELSTATMTTTSHDTDDLGPPITTVAVTTIITPVATDQTTTTTRAPAAATGSNHLELIVCFIAFAVVLCMFWSVCLLVANIRVRRRQAVFPHYRRWRSPTTTTTTLPVTLPKLMLQKSHTGRPQIVGLNRTTSVLSVTV